MKVVAFDVDGLEFLVGHFRFQWVLGVVQGRFDPQALFGAGVGDQVNNHFVADQRAAAPVLRDVAEHAVFDFVPFAGPRREMTDMDRHRQCIRQVLQRDLPQAATAAVAAAAISGHEQLFGGGMSLHAHLLPPAMNGRDREPRGVVIDPHADPAFVLGDVVNAVRNRLAQLFVDEVIDQNFFRLALREPFPSSVAVIPDQFLLFSVNRDHRLQAFLERHHAGVDVLELGIAVRVLAPFFGFAIALQTIPLGSQQSAHGTRADRMPLASQFRRQLRGAFASPAQRRHRIAACDGINQISQRLGQLGIMLRGCLASSARLTQSRRNRRLGLLRAGVQFCQPVCNRVAGDPRRAAHRDDAPPTQRPRLRSRPLSPQPLIQQRSQRRVSKFNRLDDLCIVHTAL